jgi:hypothetical protein
VGAAPGEGAGTTHLTKQNISETLFARDVTVTCLDWLQIGYI